MGSQPRQAAPKRARATAAAAGSTARRCEPPHHSAPCLGSSATPTSRSLCDPPCGPTAAVTGDVTVNPAAAPAASATATAATATHVTALEPEEQCRWRGGCGAAANTNGRAACGYR